VPRCPRVPPTTTMFAMEAAPTQTKDQVALRLAESHYRLERSISHIFRIRNGTDEEAANEPIKLLEVNADTVPTGVTPVYFGPHADRGMPYARVIVDLTPAEFDRVRSKELTLPDGWHIGEEFPRPDAE
jgi:hypothetical protein